MPESFATRLERLKFNFFPAYRGSGARITYIADDFHEIRIKIPLNWRTRNYVGTIFGGSMFSATDPIYMVMLIKILGNEYVVWDKSTNIRFKRPGKETLFAEFKVTQDELDEIRSLLEANRSIDRIYNIELKNKDGKTHAIIEKTIYIGKKKDK